MWGRITYEEWMNIVRMVAFALTAGVFLYVLWRTLRTREEKHDHAKNLPLEGDQPIDTSHEPQERP